MTNKKEYVVLEHPHVYVVLEHERHGYDACVHGVYTTRETAERKKLKIIKQTEGAVGYICILKKPIHGKKPHSWLVPENDMDKIVKARRIRIYLDKE